MPFEVLTKGQFEFHFSCQEISHHLLRCKTSINGLAYRSLRLEIK